MPFGRRLARLATLARVLWTGWFEPRFGGGCVCEKDGSAMVEENCGLISFVYMLDIYIYIYDFGSCMLYKKLGVRSLDGMCLSFWTCQACGVKWPF